jgi:hypothetical protein
MTGMGTSRLPVALDHHPPALPPRIRTPRVPAEGESGPDRVRRGARLDGARVAAGGGVIRGAQSRRSQRRGTLISGLVCGTLGAVTRRRAQRRPHRGLGPGLPRRGAEASCRPVGLNHTVDQWVGDGLKCDRGGGAKTICLTARPGRGNRSPSGEGDDRQAEPGSSRRALANGRSHVADGGPRRPCRRVPPCGGNPRWHAALPLPWRPPRRARLGRARARREHYRGTQARVDDRPRSSLRGVSWLAGGPFE